MAKLPGVLHFIETTGPGGAETVFLDLAAGLQRVGFASHAVYTGAGWVEDALIQSAIPRQLVPMRRGFDPSMPIRLARQARRLGVALIQAHLFDSGAYAVAAGVLAGVPVCVTLHGEPDMGGRSRLRWMKTRIVRQARSLVTVSQSLAERLAPKLDLSPACFSVIYNGIDVDHFAPGDGTAVRAELGVPESCLLVIAVGNIRQAKGYPVLLHAISECRRQGSPLQLVIAGEGSTEDVAELNLLAHTLGVSASVKFLGYRDDIAELLQAADVFVLSSLTEGFSLATVQAMASGCAVVASRSGGPEEIVTDGLDGMLVAPGDSLALARGIAQVAGNPALANRLRSEARSTVLQRFDRRRMLEAYAAEYEAMLGNR